MPSAGTGTAATCHCWGATTRRSRNTRARDPDPLSLIARANLTRALYWARRYDDAIAEARETLDVEPQFGVARFWLEGALRHKGLFKEAVALRQATSTSEEAQRIGHVFETLGFPAVLRETAETMKKSGALVPAARCYAQVGEKKTALALLESCAAHHCASLVSLRVEPDFDVLRDEPRFQQILRRIGPD